MSGFSSDEAMRYQRHILLKELGGPGQQKLKRARVALVGAGGLGAPAALYLAAAGIGALRLIDPDVVSLSNLQRQVLYRTADIGALKVAAAAPKLSALNPHVGLDLQAERLTPAHARALLAGCDVVLDGSDSFETRFAVNAACHEMGVALVSGAVGRWEGQVGVFASGLPQAVAHKARLPCYQCLVPEAPSDVEDCATQGIVGALTGVIGSIMALEAIKLITGAGETLAGRLLIFDGLSLRTRTLTLPPDPACAVCGIP